MNQRLKDEEHQRGGKREITKGVFPECPNFAKNVAYILRINKPQHLIKRQQGQDYELKRANGLAGMGEPLQCNTYFKLLDQLPYPIKFLQIRQKLVTTIKQFTTYFNYSILAILSNNPTGDQNLY